MNHLSSSASSEADTSSDIQPSEATANSEAATTTDPQNTSTEQEKSAESVLPAAPPNRATLPSDKPARNNRLFPKYAGVGPERGSQAKHNPAQAPRLASSLGSLEAEVMGLLWDLGKPASSMDVMEASLYKRRQAGQEPISFATIATTLRRLADKNLLTMKKGEQRTPIYTPAIEREQMAARILNNVSVTLLGQPLRRLLPRLLDTMTPTAQVASVEEQTDIARLLQAIEEAGEKHNDAF